MVCPARAHRSCLPCLMWAMSASVQVFRLWSSTYRGGVLPWDPPRRAGPNGDAALSRMFQARPPTGPSCYGCMLLSRRSPLRSSDRGRCRACAGPYCLLRLPLCSLNHSMIYHVVLSCASVASRSPLPLLCMTMLSALGSQLREWWRGSAASKYAAPRCDRE